MSLYGNRNGRLDCKQTSTSSVHHCHSKFIVNEKQTLDGKPYTTLHQGAASAPSFVCFALLELGASS